jgi:hypothetical protein
MSRQENTPEPTVVGNHRAGQMPEMLGNIAATERLLYREGQTRRRAEISVRVSFEAHRLAPTYVATAYEHLVPLRRRGQRAAARTVPAPADQRPGARAGA